MCKVPCMQKKFVGLQHLQEVRWRMAELQGSVEIATHCTYLQSPRLAFQLLARAHDNGGHYNSKVCVYSHAQCTLHGLMHACYSVAVF